MDYFNIFDISASGMEVQKVRLDTVALNLANVNSTRSAEGGPYKPLEVVVGERLAASFEGLLSDNSQAYRAGAEVVSIQPQNTEPRLAYEPGHPDANAEGFVAYPNVNPVSEMVKLMEATRAYEANVKAVNAAKTMALRALEIGENK
jgi:flagellar basal-body rod protein FlgC